MVHPHQIDDSGVCTSCKAVTNELHILECFICLVKYHADCNGIAPFTVKSFVNAFKKLRVNDNFVFICPHCKTHRENMEASSLQQQMCLVLNAVAELTKEVAQLKQEKKGVTPLLLPPDPPGLNNNNKVPQSAWMDPKRMEEVKSTKVTVCIKSDGEKIDLSKVKEVVTNNGIQVSKTSVNSKNGDVYVDLPTDEQRNKLVPLLENETLPGKTIVNVRSKCPIITIRNVPEFVDELNFVEKVKIQNKLIGEKIDAGSEFSVVFAKERKHDFKGSVYHENDTVHQVVVRISEDIREILKLSGDKLFIGFSALRVFDRFYVKSCAQCHRFGHYHADCNSTPCCGYCGATNHTSKECHVHRAKDQENYKCVNCKDANKPENGHSSHWHKCPAYIEQQRKMMMNIPYYTKN